LRSEKFRQQHTVTAGFAHGIKNRPGHRRDISQQLGTTSSDQRQLGPHGIFKPTKIVIETATRSFHVGPTAPSSAEAYFASELASYTEPVENLSETANTGPSSGQEQCHLRFSFEAGDDSGGLPDRWLESHRPNSHGSWRQDRYEFTDTIDTETGQARANNAPSLIDISGWGENGSPPGENHISSAGSSHHEYHAVVASRAGRLESGGPVLTRQYGIETPLSQERRGLSSPEHILSLKQENRQEKQSATDARIAASRAIANVRNLTRPKY
jgi:hypothetical protein